MRRLLILVACALFFATPTHAGDCSDATFAGKTCLPGENIAVSIGAADKALQTAIDDGDLGAGVAGAPVTADYWTSTSNANLSAEVVIDESSDIASQLSDETGSGALCFATNPTFPDYIQMTEITDPADPSSGSIRCWAVGGEICCEDDNGDDICMSDGGGGAGAFDDLSDCTLTSPAEGSVLIKSSGDWVDGQLDLADSDAVTGLLPDANIAATISRDSELATHTANVSAHHTKTTSAAELTTGTIPAPRVGAAHIDTMTEIDADLRTGLYKIVTSSELGVDDGECAEWVCIGDYCDLTTSDAACGTGSGGTTCEDDACTIESDDTIDGVIDAAFSGTTTFGGTSIWETGSVHQWGDGTDSCITVTWELTGMNDPYLEICDGAFNFGGNVGTGATSNPVSSFDDQDTTVETVDAAIYANATDTGTGTEDVDFWIQSQIGSTATTWIMADADEGGSPHLELGPDHAGPITIGGTNTTATNLQAGTVDAITEIDASLKSGSDATLVTGTAGTSGNCVEWNADGDIIDAGDPCGTGGGGGTDSTGTDELDDGSDTPASGEYVRVDTVDQAGFEYRTNAETRTDLGLVIGTNVQAWDADLDTLATNDGSNLTSVDAATGDSATEFFDAGTIEEARIHADIARDSEITSDIATHAAIAAAHHAKTTSTDLAEDGSDEMLGETLGTACAEDLILKANATGGLDCAADAGGAAGSPVVLDLADDASNESTDLAEIATTGDTNSIFTEPSADKLLIAVGSNWPTADSADAVAADSVALTTDTTGNYVASVATSSPLTGGAAGSEGATLTLGIDSATLTAEGAIEIATGTETNTGTDATRAVSPDGLDDWLGSAQVTTLGTIGTGTWEGTEIADGYIPSAIARDSELHSESHTIASHSDTDGSGLTGVDAATGDSATAFFDAGTIEHEYGGLEADVAAYDGLIRITGGATSNVTDLAGLNTALGTGLVTGAHTTDTTCDSGDQACTFDDDTIDTDTITLDNTWAAAQLESAMATETEAAAAVTYENLSTNGDIGFGASQVPQGSLAAPLDSPTFTTAASAPTPSVDDNDTSIATTAFVQAETVAAGDVTGTIGGGLTIGANAVEESMLKATNVATDEYVLTSETSGGGDFEWVAASTLDVDIEAGFALYVDAVYGNDTPDCADDRDLNDCGGSINAPLATVANALEIIAWMQDNGSPTCENDLSVSCGRIVDCADTNADGECDCAEDCASDLAEFGTCSGGGDATDGTACDDAADCTGTCSNTCLSDCTLLDTPCGSDNIMGLDNSCVAASEAEDDSDICSDGGLCTQNVTKRYIIDISNSGGDFEGTYIIPIGGSIIFRGSRGTRLKNSISDGIPGICTIDAHNTEWLVFEEMIVHNTIGSGLCSEDMETYCDEDSDCSGSCVEDAGGAMCLTGNNRTFVMTGGGLAHMGKMARDWNVHGRGNATLQIEDVDTFGAADDADGDSIDIEVFANIGVCRKILVDGTLTGGSATNVDPDDSGSGCPSTTRLGCQRYGTLTDADLDGESPDEIFGADIVIDGGTGEFQQRRIFDYDDSTDTILVTQPWWEDEIPSASDSTYVVYENDWTDKECDDTHGTVGGDCEADEACLYGYIESSVARNSGYVGSSSDIGMFDGNFVQPGVYDGSAVKYTSRACGSDFNITIQDSYIHQANKGANTTYGLHLEESGCDDCTGGGGEPCPAGTSSLVVRAQNSIILPETGISTHVPDKSVFVDTDTTLAVHGLIYDACSRDINGDLEYYMDLTSEDYYGGTSHLGFLNCNDPPDPQNGEMWYSNTLGEWRGYVGGAAREILFGDTASIADDDLLVYNSTSGNFEMEGLGAGLATDGSDLSWDSTEVDTFTWGSGTTTSHTQTFATDATTELDLKVDSDDTGDGTATLNLDTSGDTSADIFVQMNGTQVLAAGENYTIPQFRAVSYIVEENGTTPISIPNTEFDGRTVTNGDAAEIKTYNLGAVFAGAMIEFVAEADYDLHVNPNGSEQILGLTDTGGDKVTCDNVGDSVFLRGNPDGDAWIGTTNGCYDGE